MSLLVDVSNFALSAAIAIAFIGKMVTYILFLFKKKLSEIGTRFGHEMTAVYYAIRHF